MGEYRSRHYRRRVLSRTICSERYTDLAIYSQQFGSFVAAAATCKIGTANDSMAVVDTSMKVYGIKKLRVVDASSFPFLPPGHPQATIYAVAEEAAVKFLHGNTNLSEMSK